MITADDFVISKEKSCTLPIFIQISNILIDNIKQGRLVEGDRLLPSREMARILKVHRKTVVAAYEELASQGWISMMPRKGTFVLNKQPEIKPSKIGNQSPPAMYPESTLFRVKKDNFHPYPPSLKQTRKLVSVNDGFPDIRLAPVSSLLLEIRSLSGKSVYKGYLNYAHPAGHFPLRQAIAGFMRTTRNLHITAENVMITRGAQMAIYISAVTLLKPGDDVVVGEPNYYTANHTFHKAGAKLNRIKVDDFGIDVDALEALCKRKKIRLIYIVPHHHHPTTVTLSPERRTKILELAVQYKFAIIEDDYDYDFHYNGNPILPMASIDHYGSIIYIGTLTKTIAPSIRTGFLIAPKNFIKEACKFRRLLDRQGDMLTEAGIAEMFNNGTLARHIKKSLKIYRDRRDNFCGLLNHYLKDRVSFKVPDGGMSVWTTFGKEVEKVRVQAMEKGVEIPDPSRYNTFNIDYNSIRMGFASLNFDEQELVVSVLRKCMR
jgi:GntR family transcriptional regulator/MocR family aminotransferase